MNTVVGPTLAPGDGDPGGGLAAFGSRAWTITRGEIGERGRRGLLVVWIALTLVLGFGLVTGNVSISSGDSAVSGAKAFITSGFTVAQLVAITSLIVHGFFVAMFAGLPILRDREIGALPIMFATRLSAREYVAGKLAAAIIISLAVLALEVVSLAFSAHVFPGALPEVRGVFSLRAYTTAFVFFGAPCSLVVASAAITLAIVTGKRVPVVLFPLALVLLFGFGVWQLPETTSPPLRTLLGHLDPTGFAWLRWEFLAEDRGVAFYNTVAVPLPVAFLATRLLFCVGALVLPLFVAQRVLADPVQRGASPKTLTTRSELGIARDVRPVAPVAPSLLAMVAVELRLLRAHAGLALVVPLVILVTVQNALSARGAFETKLLATPGNLAENAMGPLTTLLVCVLLFQVIEAFHREEGARVWSLVTSTPTTSVRMVWSKVLAAMVFGASVLLLAGAALSVIVLVKNPSAFSPVPIVLLWGLLGMPTLFFAVGFFAFVATAVRQRHAAYGVALAGVVLTAWAFIRGHLSWTYNWPLWKVVRWSDLSIFEIERRSLVLNRLTVVALGAGLVVAACVLFARRMPDRDDRFARRPALRRARLRSLVLGFVPAAALFSALAFEVSRGAAGDSAKAADKDYWRANLLTFAEAKLPATQRVDLVARFAPADQRVDVEGSYVLSGDSDEPIRKIPLTLRHHMKAPRFTLDGAPVIPESRAGLYVFALPRPLTRGQKVTIGFSYRAEIGEATGTRGAREFLVASGGTLTSLSGVFVPHLGFIQGLGVDEENRTEARIYEDDFHLGDTPGVLDGAGGPGFAFRLEAHVPAEFAIHSVGVLRADRSDKGERTMVWESDAPVHFFNVVLGKNWQVAQRDGVSVYYAKEHGRQVPVMLEALAASRARYSEWFYPYPWAELRLSEFPGIAHYAQGFPTNINFSESIGFLAAPEENLPFAITAHEAGHQWWGTLLSPARGPGASVLTEGLSHMSALLLLEDVKGPEARRAFARMLEDRYAKERSVDGERPLLRVDGTRKGDSVLMYERAGWAFWMLQHHLGMERFSRGMHSLIERFRSGNDHATVRDVLEELGRVAEDRQAFDRLVHTWFETTSVPRLRVTNARREPTAGSMRFELTNEGTGQFVVRVRVRGKSGEQKDVMVDVKTAQNTVELEVPFPPHEIEVDPDVELLQLGRSTARAIF